MTVRVLRVVLSLVVLAVSVACRPDSTAPGTDRIAGWRSDLQFLDSVVPRMHPPPATDPSFATFHAAIATLAGQVSEFTDERIVTNIQRILAGIGDGHTTIIPDDVGAVVFYALRTDFYWFDDGVYIVGVRPGLGALLNARVTAVGGLPIDTLMSRLVPFVPHDNSMSARWLGAQLMQYTALLRATGATSSDAATTLDIVNAAGTAQTVTIAATANGALSRLPPAGGMGVTPQTPRYLRNPERAFWVDSLVADRTLYVAFNGVRDDSPETLAQFAARLDGILRGGAFPNVILDVRLNNGGNSLLLPPLLQTLKTFSDASGAHRLYVIIGRSTFSAAQTFVTQLEKSARVVFVGEPTGSRPNHIGDQSDTPLPYSQIRVSIASRLHQDAGPSDTRPWIAPHIVVPVLATDYIANRDPAFDAALAAIRRP